MPKVSYRRFEQEVLELYALKQPATLTKMRQALREFGELEGVKWVSDIKPVLIARWLNAHPGRAVATQDAILRSFSAACTIAVASGYLKSSPCELVTLDLEDYEEEDEDEDDAEKQRHYSITEIRKILDLASAEAAAHPLEWKPARLEALVYTYAFAALRKTEALRLQRKDVDLESRLIHVKRRRIKRTKRKTLKTRASAAAVPIPTELVQVYERWLPRCGSQWVFPGVRNLGPWTGGPPGHKPLDQIKALGERAGVDGLTILSFRHSFATHSQRWGISEPMLKSILRHTTLRTQKHYLHVDAENLRAAADTVSF